MPDPASNPTPKVDAMSPVDLILHALELALAADKRRALLQKQADRALEEAKRANAKAEAAKARLEQHMKNKSPT